ncbi:hypothetical protein NX88_11255 [Neisseria meningitidis]|nr:hypothetical protein NX88_11255 [Neisseria meningitidis]
METLPAKLDKTPQSLIHIRHNLSEIQYKYWYLLLKYMKENAENPSVFDKDGFIFADFAVIHSNIGYEVTKKENKRRFDKNI